MPSPDQKDLLLGTAQWAWTVDKPAAFRLLDAWLRAGGREVDSATNYPINRQPTDFRAAERWLHEYVRAHGLHGELQITMKVGSLNNMRSPEVNLAPSFLLMMGEEYLRLFGENLRGVMIHWDNRDDADAIGESLGALARLKEVFDLVPGLSGIAQPETYARANEQYGLAFDVEFKHNLLQSDIKRYEPFFEGGHRLIAYGLNAGGLKLDGTYSAQSTLVARGATADYGAALVQKLQARLPVWNTAHVRPPLKTMNHLGLLYAGLDPRIGALLIGASTVAQLNETLDFWRNVGVFEYEDVWREMTNL
jgi:aryl-alcohol dehydrogenase-like predicted oxidoreductase